MSASFLLRDADGCTCGYIILQGDTLYCGVTKSLSDGVLCIIDNCNHKKEYALPGDLSECMFEYREESVCLAMVFDGPTLICASDWQAARENAGPKERVEMNDQESQSCAPGEADLRVADVRRWPDRRWPPPCILPAQYENGRWVPRYQEDI